MSNGIKDFDVASLNEIRVLKQLIKDVSCDVALCLPATLLTEAIRVVDKDKLIIGAQNCHYERSGAHTGEISAEMLHDLQVKLVILGHSERRVAHNESSAMIKKKAKTSNDYGLTTIICVGETEKEKLSKKTYKIITSQLTDSLPETATFKNTIIAYEPIWAIGTGKVPKREEIFKIHSFIRNLLAEIQTEEFAAKVRVIYGGSVNTSNASEILTINGVDGALIGGASLLASDFSQIVKSA